MPTTSTRSASSTKSSMPSTTWLTEPSISASISVFVSSSSPFISHFARCVSFTFVTDHLSVFFQASTTKSLTLAPIGLRSWPR
ncbi:unnamed protein product [Musa hybrid cultivar]